jgi:hypothetical protein
MIDWANEDDWPDWRDSGRAVEIQDEHGNTLVGKLIADDFISGGENGSDEIPIFRVITADGKSHSFAGARRWRFCTQPIVEQPPR